jgi:hypothetical protein
LETLSVPTSPTLERRLHHTITDGAFVITFKPNSNRHNFSQLFAETSYFAPYFTPYFAIWVGWMDHLGVIVLQILKTSNANAMAALCCMLTSASRETPHN